MTPDITNLETRIDKEKRQQEAALFSYLVTLAGRTQRQTYAAARVGMNPVQAASDVLGGNPGLGIPSPAPVLAGYLAAAEVMGYRRTTLVIPGKGIVANVGRWLSTAAQSLARMLGTLQRRLALALAQARQGVSGALQALRAAFEAGGYVQTANASPWLLRTAAETLVGEAYSDGYFNGWKRVEAAAQLRGFRYSAVLDAGTTTICRAYDEVKLPTDHVWWLQHWPLCHFGCRSVVLPIVGSFEATETPPWDPAPMPGFGRAPFALIGRAA